MITDIICGGQNLMMTDFEKVLGSENAKISVIEVKTMSSDSGNTEAKVDQESRFKKLPEKKELDQISNSTSTAEDRSIK